MIPSGGDSAERQEVPYTGWGVGQSTGRRFHTEVGALSRGKGIPSTCGALSKSDQFCPEARILSRHGGGGETSM